MADYPVTAAAQSAFDAAYWASQPPQIAALQQIAAPDARIAEATVLAQQGFLIDVPIMAWGWDAYLTMVMRAEYGYAWVPSALMAPVPVAPGYSIPGLATYDPDNPPAGSIKVSTNPADYPPFAPPPPPPPAPNPTALIGANTFGSIYAATYYCVQQVVAGLLKNGATTTVNGQTFTLYAAQGPMGWQVCWALASQ